MSSTFQKKLQQDRSNQETSNAGLRWEAEDDKYLQESAVDGVSISDIAKKLKRTEGSIKTRLIITVLNIRDETSTPTEELCKKYGISQSDLTQYEQRKKQREDRRQKKTIYRDNDNGFPSGDLAEVLDGLTQLNNKMDKLLESNRDILKSVKK